MISKKDFIEALDTIAEYQKKEEKLTKDLHEFLMNGHSVVSFTGKLQDILLKQISQRISEDDWQSVYDNLTLFAYEYDFGKIPYELIWHKKDETEKSYDIKSSEEMYDWLVEFFRKDD